MTEAIGSIIRCPCNLCGQETDHEVVWENVRESGPQATLKARRRARAVRCCGCNELAVREEVSFFIKGEEETVPFDQWVHYKPFRLWRKPPNWLGDLEQIDEDLKGLLDEIYEACNDEQTRLLSMGVRSALDHVMTLILGGDFGIFEQKLDQMVEKQHLTQNQRENIAIVIDAGSASSHRGFKPPRALIEEMVVVMENMVREHYITGPMLKTAKQKIPPRPPRRPAQESKRESPER